MDQFLSRLLDRYGLLRIVIAIIVGFLALWALAHITAAPGGNVSVLWGLVQYTKSKPGTPTVILNTAGDQAIKNQTAGDQKQEIEDSSSVASPELSGTVKVVHGITKKNVEETLRTLRRQRQLRELDALESGRRVKDTPRGSYFFVYYFHMRVTSGSMAKTLSEAEANRYRNGDDASFEIHYPVSGSPSIVGFASESDAARLSGPSNGIRKISLSALPWEKMSSLVSVPANEIKSVQYRKLDISESKQIYVLDVDIK